MGFFTAIKKFFGQEKDEAAESGAQAHVDEIQAEKGQITEEAPQKQAPAENAETEAEISALENIENIEPEKPEATEVEEAEEIKAQSEADIEQGPEPETVVQSEIIAETQEEERPEAQETEIIPEEADSGQVEEIGESESLIETPEAIEPEVEEARAEEEEIPREPAKVTATEIAEKEETAAEAAEESAPMPAAEIMEEAAASEIQKAEKIIEEEPLEAEEPGGARAETNAEEQALVLRLRQAEPRLSQWLDIVLEDQEQVDDRFWNRLKFLLRSLEAPEAEIEAFTADFGRWLQKMDYVYIDEFRSELQYRLALALDMEDEEDERNRLLVKLGSGLAATREQLGRRLDSLFSRHGNLDAAFWEEMEELFIMADMGYEPSLEIVERLKGRAAKAKIDNPEEARQLLQDELEEIFKAQPAIRAANKPEVILMMGVNGAGKTTTIAKLAHRDRMNGKKVLIVAGDTFRAAAIEQLQVWADRAGVDFYSKAAGSDPASVAWEAMDYALKNNIDVVYMDTAGRLQTRVNLMEELGKIRQVLGRKHAGAPHRNVLVLDATTGQNALSQAKLFREAAGADEIILTKLDGTAKGGVAIAIAMREKLPISFIGLGEKMEDLRPFNGRDFARAILEDPAA